MYNEMIQQFIKTLTNFQKIIDKAIKNAEERQFDPNNFLTARLAPDMFTFTRQVQIACDVAKAAAAGITGTQAPKHEDNETTMVALKERIQKVITYLQSFKASDLSDVDPKRVVKIPFPQGKAMHAQDAFIGRSIPNFFFHVSMAYALLRQGGVPIGKGDFLGELKIFDAP